MKIFNRSTWIILVILSFGFLHGFGQNAFIRSWSSSGGSQTWDVAAGDLDGDGNLDLCLANEEFNGNSSEIMLNLGGLQPEFETINLGEQATAVDIGDLDNDGDMDICLLSMQHEVIIMKNNGSGEFVRHPQTWQTSSGWEDIRLVDINGDSYIDILLLNLFHPAQLFLNHGDMSFSLSDQEFGPQGEEGTGAIQIADVNGDSHIDIIKGNYGYPKLEVFLNDGSGLFSSTLQSFGNHEAHIHAIGADDIDNDGDFDLVIGYSSPSIGCQIWHNDGTGKYSFLKEMSLSGTNLVQDIDFIDYDHDGDRDIILATLDGANPILENDGEGSFIQMETSLDGHSSLEGVVADFNSDGLKDYFSINNTWFECDGNNHLWLSSEVSTISSIETQKPLTVFPIPAENILHLRGEFNPGAIQYRIFDTLGRIVQFGEIHQKMISVSQIPAGFYNLCVRQGGVFHSLRFIVT